MRNCKLTCNGKEYEIKSGTLLSEFLRREGMAAEMPCGGLGRCGKCKVKFVYGESTPTSADRRFFSEVELENGQRLSCRAVITQDAEIEVTSLRDELTDVKEDKDSVEDNIDECRIAVDLGTTTIAAALVSPDGDGRIIKKAVTMNHQKSFGADVISRIKAANEGNAQKLKEQVVSDILEVIKRLIGDNGASVKEVVIAGNTTMLHLLTGDSCEGLGKAPYKPVRLSYPEMKFNEIFGEVSASLGADCTLRIMPGISAFVGADIVAGMYELGFSDIPEGETYMLIDLGTNGEMAVADSEKITVCSTAAGPVFEGGGISCGMAGVNGAVEHVRIDGKSFSADIKTIGDTEPVGICGSGVLELVSELRRENIIDETGLLMDEFFEDGFVLYKKDDGKIVFTQNDIRAVQLAKAAIRSGIETLLSEHGCKTSDINKVYIAGGFSEHLDTKMIRYLKFLPEDFINRSLIECAGNTSLKGCVKALSDGNYEEATANIIRISNEIPLADMDAFEESFFDAMNL